MLRKLYRSCLVPVYVAAILFIALWQNQVFYSQNMGFVRKEEGVPEVRNGEQDLDGSLNPRKKRLEILGEADWTLPTETDFEESINHTKYAGKPKEILVWNGGFSQENLGGCPHWNCIITSDTSRLNRSQAVIFHNGIGMGPKKRDPEQYYVFFTQESPMHMSVQEPYPGFFNLSMGYRRDADLPCPYGYAVKRETPMSTAEFNQSFSIERLSTKKKPIAWFVSNCGSSSQRDQYVSQLQNYIPVDIFGACGKLSCPKSQTNECLMKLRNEYYFYLALENSICKDYTTEKFWEKGALIPIVPIVLKRSLLASYVPPKSFIAVDDFASPQAMAEYLQQLIDRPAMYAEYFKWRMDFEIIFLNGNLHDRLEQPWGFCRLCDLLWKTPRPRKIRFDIRKWWNEESSCDSSLVKKLLKPSTKKKRAQSRVQ